MLVILPFAILIATFGVEYLLAGAAPRRLVAIVLLVLAPVQFYVFYMDYMGDYRLRSTFWFERNIRGVVEEVIARDEGEHVPAVYLSQQEIPWVEWYWKFYLLKHAREDLLRRTMLFKIGELDPHQIPPGALIVSNADSALKQRLVSSGMVREEAVIREPDGKASFVIFER